MGRASFTLGRMYMVVMSPEEDLQRHRESVFPLKFSLLCRIQRHGKSTYGTVTGHPGHRWGNWVLKSYG